MVVVGLAIIAVVVAVVVVVGGQVRGFSGSVSCSRIDSSSSRVGGWLWVVVGGGGR